MQRLTTCPRCGAAIGMRHPQVAQSGWAQLPARKDMAKLQFGNSFCQIEGTYVPVADMNLAADDGVYFAHHVLLWKDPQVNITTMSLKGGWKRLFAGLPLIMTQAQGPGHIAFSLDNPGELIALPLQPGQVVDVREHLFLAATSNVHYDWFPTQHLAQTSSGDETETHYPIGMYMDQFCARKTPGLLLLHAGGNVFVRHAGAGRAHSGQADRADFQGSRRCGCICISSVPNSMFSGWGYLEQPLCLAAAVGAGTGGDSVGVRAGGRRSPEPGELLQRDRAALVRKNRGQMPTPDMRINQRWLLTARPTGNAKEGDFTWDEGPADEPGEGRVVVRTIYLSLDPTNRVWMNDADSYLPAIVLGSVMRGVAIGVVEESRNSHFAVGDLVQGLLGWQRYAVSDGRGLAKLPRLPIPFTAYLGVLGHIGLTAYFGLLDVGRPRAGETLVVSAGAGAVGCAGGTDRQDQGLPGGRDCRVGRQVPVDAGRTGLRCGGEL